MFDGLADGFTSDDDCIARLKIAATPLPEVGLRNQQPVLGSLDESGDNVLFDAAYHLRIGFVRHILDVMPFLAQARNNTSDTPLEFFRLELEAERDSGQSDDFEGFPLDCVRCLCLLTGAQYCELEPTMDGAERLIDRAIRATVAEDRNDPQLAIIRNTLRFKYGCSCTTCIGGFLSPRMRYCLEDRAMFLHGALQEPVTVVFQGILPAELGNELVKHQETRAGLQEMFRQFAKCLQQGLVPLEDNISSGQLPATATKYLQGGGGQVSYIANCVFQLTYDNDQLTGAGVGKLERVDNKWHNALPVCRNDHEFGFVSARCGYTRKLSQ